MQRHTCCCRELGIATPDKIILAGAFGSHIDTTRAMLLGMIPDCPLDRVFSVGNAAGDGARIALLNREKRLEAQEIARTIRRVGTAGRPRLPERVPAGDELPPHVAQVRLDRRSHPGPGARSDGDTS